MSRMKKAKVGDKSKKKAALTALTEKPGFEDKLSIEGKEFYLLQIRNLEEQLDRYQVKCYELEVEKTDFSTRCSDLENEKRDIVQYLKRSLEKVEDELAGVTEHLASVQQAKEEGTDSLERQLGLLRQEYQEKHDKLASENTALAGKLAALKEFEEQRERLKADLDSLEKQLTNQKEEQSAAIYDLEKKAVLDNDSLTTTIL